MKTGVLVVLIAFQLVTVLAQDFTEIMQPGISVALEVAAIFNTACLRIIHSRHATLLQQHQTQQFARGMMRGLERPETSLRFLTVSPISFSHFLANQRRGHDLCYKPLEFFITSNDSKRDFTWLCKNSKRISSSIWIVFMIDGHTVEDFFRDVPLPFDIHLLAITNMTNTSSNGIPSKLIREVYRITPHSPLKMVPVGHWSPKYGLNIITSSIYHRRRKLDGLVVHTGSIENWPITSFREETLGTYKLDGFLARVWSELEELLDFRSIYYRSVDNSTGIREENGTWNGLVGMLLRNEIDFIVSELNINQERTEVMDFSHPLLKTRYQVYFEMTGYNHAWTAVFQPFHLSLWLALVSWIAVGGCILSFCFWVSRPFTTPSDLSLQPTRTIFFMLQSMCQQGYDQVPEACSCRLMFMLAYVLSAIIIPSYSASLVSSLTAQTPNRPFDSLQQMLEFKRHRLLIAKNSAEYSHFALSQDDLYSRVFRELVVEGTNPLSTAEQMNLVCNRKAPLAIFGVESTVDLRVDSVENSKPDCQIIKFSQPLSIVYQGLGFRKGHPLSGVIDFQIGRMFGSGIVGRLQRAVWPLTPSRRRRDTDFRQVSTSDVFEIFMCLVMGILISVVMLIAEIMYESSRHRNGPSVPRKQQPPNLHYLN